MEIHVNGIPVARVNGLTRDVSVKSDGGEITSFSVAPGARVLNIVTQQKLPAHAPRLDELELLRYMEALENGDLGPQEGQDDDTPLSEMQTERISTSEFDTDENDGETGTDENDNESQETDENDGDPQKQDFILGANS